MRWGYHIVEDYTGEVFFIFDGMSKNLLSWYQSYIHINGILICWSAEWLNSENRSYLKRDFGLHHWTWKEILTWNPRWSFDIFSIKMLNNGLAFLCWLHPAKEARRITFKGIMLHNFHNFLWKASHIIDLVHFMKTAVKFNWWWQPWI